MSSISLRIFSEPAAYRATIVDMHAYADHLARHGRAGNGQLWLLEHHPVYTIGKRGSYEHLVAPHMAAQAGIEVVPSDRGGDITYHGPGQLVAYPIYHLGHRERDVKEWIEVMEQAMLATLAEFALTGQRIEGKRGVFVETRKIGAVGIRIAQQVSRHGLALNVTPNLQHFQWIVPCGLHAHPTTSMAHECARPLPLEEVRPALSAHLQDGIRRFFCRAD